MPNQNRDQAEQLVAEVLAAACLAIENDAGSANDRNVIRHLLRCAFEALRSRHISVHSQVGVLEFQLPSDRVAIADPGAGWRVVMRTRGRQVVLDRARLQSHCAFMTMGRWCRSALRSNLQRAFRILGHPEFR